MSLFSSRLILTKSSQKGGWILTLGGGYCVHRFTQTAIRTDGKDSALDPG